MSPFASWLLVRQQRGARDDGHGKPAAAEFAVPIDRFLQRDRAVHGDRAAGLVLDVVLAPLEEIMIALAPGHHAVVIADRAQAGLEFTEVVGDRGRQHGFAKGDAIEGVVAHDELFRRAAVRRSACIPGSVVPRSAREMKSMRCAMAGSALASPIRRPMRASPARLGRCRPPRPRRLRGFAGYAGG